MTYAFDLIKWNNFVEQAEYDTFFHAAYTKKPTVSSKLAETKIKQRTNILFCLLVVSALLE
jgi:hypothetical protein